MTSQTGVVAWSKTASSNNTADSAVNWSEGMAPSAVNDSARAQMASVAKYRDDTAGSLLTSGTSTAYTLTTNQVFSGLSVLNGQELTVRFHAANGASPNLAVDGLTAEPLYVNSTTAVGAGVIGANTIWRVTYDSSIPAFILNSVPAQVQDGTVATASLASKAVTAAKIADNTITSSQIAAGVVPVLPPQGRLTPVSATPVINGDSSAATTIYYAEYAGNQVPIYDGTSFSLFTFSNLSLALSASSQSASGIYDVFAFNNSGSAAIAFGPSWAGGTGGSITAGSCARGTGTGGTGLTRVNGIYVNAAAFSAANNGSSTYAISANQGTYLGSVFIDGSNGQVSCLTSYGQSRKWGIWNCYNRIPIFMKVGDSTSTWTYNSSTIRQTRASAGNTGAIFVGLQEERVNVIFDQSIAIGNGGATAGATYIGYNSTTAATGIQGFSNYAATLPTATAKYTTLPSIGVNNVNMLESAPIGTPTFNGTESSCLMTIDYRA